MRYQVSEVTLIISVGTGLLLALGTFVMTLLVIHRNRALTYQRNVDQLHDAHRRELLTVQLEVQNQTFHQVAEDLHDHVGQMLAVVCLHLNRLQADTEATPYHAAVTELLAHTATLVTDVRSLSKSLSTDTIARFGLSACLELEIGRINRARPWQQAVMQVLGEAQPMGQQTEIVLLRMVQESLNNALKHAPGTPITLTLEYQPDSLQIRVADQGPGFLMRDVEANPLSGAGQGVQNLRRRASLLGGTCTWESATGPGNSRSGTCVSIGIPFSKSVEGELIATSPDQARRVTNAQYIPQKGY